MTDGGATRKNPARRGNPRQDQDQSAHKSPERSRAWKDRSAADAGARDPDIAAQDAPGPGHDRAARQRRAPDPLRVQLEERPVAERPIADRPFEELPIAERPIAERPIVIDY